MNPLVLVLLILLCASVIYTLFTQARYDREKDHNEELRQQLADVLNECGGCKHFIPSPEPHNAAKPGDSPKHEVRPMRPAGNARAPR